MPLSIISNYGTQFTYKYWKLFHKGLVTKVMLNTAYQPQSDGQIKRIIQTLEDMLKAYVLEFKGN